MLPCVAPTGEKLRSDPPSVYLRGDCSYRNKNNRLTTRSNVVHTYTRVSLSLSLSLSRVRTWITERVGKTIFILSGPSHWETLLSIEREHRWRVTGRLFTYFNLPRTYFTRWPKVVLCLHHLLFLLLVPPSVCGVCRPRGRTEPPKPSFARKLADSPGWPRGTNASFFVQQLSRYDTDRSELLSERGLSRWGIFCTRWSGNRVPLAESQLFQA